VRTEQTKLPQVTSRLDRSESSGAAARMLLVGSELRRTL
jgi:hypothetical protein